MALMESIKGPFVWSSLVMVILVGFGLFPVLCYMTKKITDFVWNEDKVIPLMLFALATTTASIVIYYIWMVCIYQWP
jgi:hypothetical protein